MIEAKNAKGEIVATAHRIDTPGEKAVWQCRKTRRKLRVPCYTQESMETFLRKCGAVTWAEVEEHIGDKNGV